jgi:hypothetical protein
MIMKLQSLSTIAGCLIFLLCAKSPQNIAGGGTDVSNGKIMGKVVAGNGVASSNVWVTMRKSSFDPVACSKSATCTTTTAITDSTGYYLFEKIPQGTYTIETYAFQTGQRSLRTRIVIKTQDTATLLTDTLRWTGRLRVHLPDSLIVAGGYLYIPGTGLNVFADAVKDSQGYLDIDSVPAAILPAIYFRDLNSNRVAIDTNDVLIHESENTEVEFETDDSLHETDDSHEYGSD